ncbi:MAG: HAMP domain-containing histidine kinase [Lutibacter sp.]|nr:HAMP domain-containing histidine kinase [Lutibacter sp.]
MKFKNRIAYFNTLSAGITTTLVFIIIYIVVNKTAFSHLDNDIILEKNEVLSNLNFNENTILINKMPEWDEAEHNKVEVNPTFLQLVDENGKIIFHSENLLNNQFLFNPKIEQEAFYNSEINGQKIRLGQFPIKNKSGKIIGHLTIAVSQKESYLILNNLTLALLISFPMLLFIQYIASSLAASKAIIPVYELIKTTSGISESNIGTRLQLPERKDELYKLTNTINELLARIEKSMLQQKQFTSDASHEIRTPLSAIRGTLEVLIRKQREPLIYEEKIGNVIKQVDRLDVLLDQLLKISRIESGISFEKTEIIFLWKIIETFDTKWNQLAEFKNIKIKYQITKESTIIGDVSFLELMLDNLVSNAIKYGKNNGTVFITWDPLLKKLSIKDDGIGIEKNHLRHIFDSFYRADESRSSDIKGYGLGLSIVKKLADLQRIKIEVKSISAVGSTFTLQFTQ